MDWFLGVIGFEEEELSDDGGRHGFVDLAVQAYYSFLNRGVHSLALK
jgi:hypothetical protein